MQVTETANEGLKREFKIVIPARDFEKKIENELAEYGRQANLPGFRPGKIPMPVLKQRFGSSVRGKVIQNTVQDASFQILNERGLKAAGQPRIERRETRGKGFHRGAAAPAPHRRVCEQLRKLLISRWHE